MYATLTSALVASELLGEVMEGSQVLYRGGENAHLLDPRSSVAGLGGGLGALMLLLQLLLLPLIEPFCLPRDA